MKIQKETYLTKNRYDADSNEFRNRIKDNQKEMWLQKYAFRILKAWSKLHTPLGVAPCYINRIKKDLVRFYDDPLKRLFIEATY